MRTLILTCVLLLSAACARVPSLDEAQAREVVQAARELLDSFPGQQHIPEDRWPAVIRKLEPNSVLVNEEGIYIATYTLYVEAAGLFVPRDPSTFVPVVGSDPSYKPMHPPLFSYFIAG